VQALSTAAQVELAAMADAFIDRIESSLAEIQRARPNRVDVPASRRFLGFEGTAR
jgi:myo-inositol 2-dehydrogenase / D-chiro-inositol 1-dehydrogenase